MDNAKKWKVTSYNLEILENPTSLRLTLKVVEIFNNGKKISYKIVLTNGDTNIDNYIE